MDLDSLKTKKSRLFASQGPKSLEMIKEEIKRINNIYPELSTNNLEIEKKNLSSDQLDQGYISCLTTDIKQQLKGRRLTEFLDHDFQKNEFENLSTALQNLVIFSRSLSSTAIIEFQEKNNLSHLIIFSDYAFHRIKFRAIFNIQGHLTDVEMLAGEGTFVPITKDFKVKRQVVDIFNGSRAKMIRFLKSDSHESSKNTIQPDSTT